MSHTPLKPQVAAFTRLELLATCAALALAALIAWPALAGGRVRSNRVLCANNLRQIGMALQQWGDEHDDMTPWEIGLGGTAAHALAPNVWYHFAWLSNELATPKILFCPTDTGQPARDFSGDPTGGYLHPNFANRATSYFLAHTYHSEGNAMVAGDHNLIPDATTGCSRFRSAFLIRTQPYPIGGKWTHALHNNAGNILTLDGRVEEFTSPQLQSALADPFGDNGSVHYITPR